MSSLAYAPPSLDDIDAPEVQIQFEDNTFEPTIPSEENFESQVREAQEQLAQLRQREEQLERQKRELEDLHRRKASFCENQLQLNSELTRAISILDRESEESQRKADQCLNSKESLEHYLLLIGNLRPENWSRSQLKDELSQSQSQLAEAEEELRSAAPLIASASKSKGMKMSVTNSSSSYSDSGHSFMYWFRSGIAFTLPVMIFAAVFGLFYLMFGAS